jgi:hypothetical protein
MPTAVLPTSQPPSPFNIHAGPKSEWWTYGKRSNVYELFSMLKRMSGKPWLVSTKLMFKLGVSSRRKRIFFPFNIHAGPKSEWWTYGKRSNVYEKLPGKLGKNIRFLLLDTPSLNMSLWTRQTSRLTRANLPVQPDTYFSPCWSEWAVNLGLLGQSSCSNSECRAGAASILKSVGSTVEYIQIYPLENSKEAALAFYFEISVLNSGPNLVTGG